jgi:hypothetical protein
MQQLSYCMNFCGWREALAMKDGAEWSTRLTRLLRMAARWVEAKMWQACPVCQLRAAMEVKSFFPLGGSSWPLHSPSQIAGFRVADGHVMEEIKM